MLKNYKVLFATLAAVLGISVIATHAQVNTDVYLSVSAGTVSIGTTGSFNFGAFGVSAIPVITGKQFTGNDYFWVNDMKSANSGYYTTLSITDLTGSVGTISGSNVSIKVDSTATTLITGMANSNVTVSNTLLSYTPLNAPVTFIQRTAGENSGKIGLYAAFPWLQITIPAYQAVGSYHGTLTYTIYEN